MMITKDYIRDPSHIESLLNVIDSKVSCKKALIVQYPKRYLENDMSELSTYVTVYGLFAIIDEEAKKYSLVNVSGFIDMLPYKYEFIKINEEDYVNLYFEEGDIIINSTDLVVKDEHIYKIVNEFYFKAKIPYYVSYEDIPNILDTTSKFCGVDLNKNPAITELMVSIIARTPEDLNVKLRNKITSEEDLKSIKGIEYVGLDNVFYSMNNTVSRLAGSYFEDALVSSLVIKSNKVSTVEKILKA